MRTPIVLTLGVPANVQERSDDKAYDNEACGILVVTGILVGHFTMLSQARRAGLDTGCAAELCVWAIVCGLLGAHWFKLAYQPLLLRRDPLMLIRVFNGMASFGGVAGGLIGAAGNCRGGDAVPVGGCVCR